MTITLHERTDRDEIGDAIALGDDKTIVVLCDYTDLKAASNILNIDTDFGPGEKPGLYMLLDKASALYEGASYIFVVQKTSKTFNLGNSFIRDVETVAKPGLTPIPDDSVLKVRFEIPGFASNNFREIDLLYNGAFDSGDVALVAEIGIVLTGDGLEFTIDNAVECKVSFSRPSGAVLEYVIDFPEYNDIIAP